MRPQKTRSRSTSPSIRVPSEHRSFFTNKSNYLLNLAPLLENRRYRYLLLFILILIIFTLFRGFFTFLYLWENDKLILEKQTYDPLPYLGIADSISNKLPVGTTIYHVSKEFGPAILSNVGQTVTGLAQAQAKEELFNVNVIIPYYSYLKPLYKTSKYAQIKIRIQDNRGRWHPIKISVNRFLWNITNNPNDMKPIPVQVYLIGTPKEVYPIETAFTAHDVTEIYSSPHQELEDIYFCKAAAELITFLNMDVDTPLFAVMESRGVDIVHIHGASNALVTEFMRSIHLEENIREPQPAIVYTLHDYTEEQLYSNSIANVGKFMDLKNYTETKYFNRNRMYTSAIGIDQAQAVTFVSEIFARKIIESPFDFYAKELIMPSILRRAYTGDWFGITSGFDSTIYNPFYDLMLMETDSKFPANIYSFDKSLLNHETVENSLQPLITTSKLNAKIHLIREGLLPDKDINRTIVLFVGQFKYSEGLEFFRAAAELLSSINVKFVIMGYKNDYPLHLLKQLEIDYPDDVTVIDDGEFQMNWGILYRAAADILFLPNKEVNFGLTPAEGLVFGCPIVSTKIEGVKEYLVNKTSINKKSGYNSYLFDIIDENNVQLSVDVMKIALINSVNDLERLNDHPVEKEIFIRSLVKSAFRLKWDRTGGPLEDYIRVYRKSLLKVRNDIDEVETLMPVI